jgi:hypothetical protein
MEENLNQNQEVQNEATQPNPEMPVQEPAPEPQAPQQPEEQPHQQYQQPYQQPYQPQYQQPYQMPMQVRPIPPQRPRRNVLGGTGFVLGVIGIALFWLPFVRFILGVLGFTFSLVSIFRKNCRKAFAIAGLILSALVLFIVAVIWFHFGYTLSDIFDEDFVDFLNFLDK